MPSAQPHDDGAEENPNGRIVPKILLDMTGQSVNLVIISQSPLRTNLTHFLASNITKPQFTLQGESGHHF